MSSVNEMKMEVPNLKISLPEEDGLLGGRLVETPKTTVSPIPVKTLKRLVSIQCMSNMLLTS